MNRALLNQVIVQLAEDYKKLFGASFIVKNQSVLGGGCINNTMKLETNQGLFFLKWNANGPVDLFVREAESLNEFHKEHNDYLIFPKPILVKLIDDLPGYLLTDYLEAGLTNADDKKLGWGLAQLHKLSDHKFGFKNNNYCGATLQNNAFKSDWVTFYKENRIGYLINLIRNSRGWSVNDQKVSDRFLNRLAALLPDGSIPSLIHGDLWSGNYLYTIKAPALIDPCVSYCDREFEMGMMKLFGGFSPTVYDAYNEAFPLPQGWQDRNLIYQLYHLLNHYYLFGGAYKYQAMNIMRRHL